MNRGSVLGMSRKKQAEKYKILYTPPIKRLRLLFLDPTLHIYTYNVATMVRSGINEYVAMAGFDSMVEAKAYRRKKIKEES